MRRACGPRTSSHSRALTALLPSATRGVPSEEEQPLLGPSLSLSTFSLSLPLSPSPSLSLPPPPSPSLSLPPSPSLFLSLPLSPPRSPSLPLAPPSLPLAPSLPTSPYLCLSPSVCLSLPLSSISGALSVCPLIHLCASSPMCLSSFVHLIPLPLLHLLARGLCCTPTLAPSSVSSSHPSHQRRS